ncbi:type II CAAX endopeptidase family protein [Chitinophaga agri]|uniref:CPBP family intramembrane metalloprotease n=1 Tax=Chitinophaga agri TaxID=2703787 RepID=A0A6B9ZCD7_9BACT|nr:type II CAAX endopeptidase family protein [Chitinophaga agri]QHS59151.1 CPBP family intramembrane metalloprotease [Chitinophaga agri]
MKPLIIYFSLAYLISWTIWFPLYSPAFGILGLPVLPFNHGIGGSGPIIASFITTYIIEKKNGIKRLSTQLFRFKPLTYLLVALLSPFLLAIMASLIDCILHKTPFCLSGLFVAREFPSFSFPQFFLYNLFFFGFGEEAGWRGFALPQLQSRFSALTASLILTVFWALWHLPLFLYRPGFLDIGISGTFGWLFSLLTGSILLTWLYNSSKASILVCAVFHSTVDIAFLADFTNKNIINYMGVLITIWGIATIFIFKPRHLARTERIKKTAGYTS